MLYLHIPFCASKCAYCDFYSVALRGVDTSAVVSAMCGELAARRWQTVGAQRSIYFGGGTPSVLRVDQVAELLATIRLNYELAVDCEITFEANPEQLNSEYLDGLIWLGVNRLSVGVQSFDDRRLSDIGRRHSADRAIEAVAAAQGAGFGNISVDLMFGFQDMTLDEWQSQVKRALSLGVQHISAYQLSIEPRTLFARKGVGCASDELSVEQYNLLCRLTAQAGFEHYEISNFALSGCRSGHNSGYWTGVPYLGIGPAAHSFDGDRCRSWNTASIKDYVGGVASEQELLTDIDLHNEFLMTRLRTADGFSIDCYQKKFDRQFIAVEGLIVDGDRVYIAPQNLFVADSIISSLFEVE